MRYGRANANQTEGFIYSQHFRHCHCAILCLLKHSNRALVMFDVRASCSSVGGDDVDINIASAIEHTHIRTSAAAISATVRTSTSGQAAIV